MIDGTMKGVITNAGSKKSHLFKTLIDKTSVCADAQKHLRSPKIIKEDKTIPGDDFHKATKLDRSLWQSTIKINHSTKDNPEHHDESKVNDDPLKEKLMDKCQMK